VQAAKEKQLKLQKEHQLSSSQRKDSKLNAVILQKLSATKPQLNDFYSRQAKSQPKQAPQN